MPRPNASVTVKSCTCCDAPREASGKDEKVERVETDDQTDQDSRSPGHRAAASVTAMDITIHTTFLPHDDPDASLVFWRDALGFEVRTDVGQGKMRWITVGPAGQPGTSILLGPPAVDPGVTDDERRLIAEMMAKGTYGWLILATADLDGAFKRVEAAGAEVVQEPVDQPYGVRDCAFRDPAGNLIRIQPSSSCADAIAAMCTDAYREALTRDLTAREGAASTAGAACTARATAREGHGGDAAVSGDMDGQPIRNREARTPEPSLA
jgi:catechol 2,3-dioxygenase-like lactoylglutathione lyase family enzyme